MDKQEARSGGPQQRLVAGNGQQIDRHLLGVNRKDTGTLGGIDHEQDALITTPGANILDRLESTGHVRTMIHHEHARPGQTCFADRSGSQFIRLAYSFVAEQEIEEAIRRLGRALEAASRSGPPK